MNTIASAGIDLAVATLGGILSAKFSSPPKPGTISVGDTITNGDHNGDTIHAEKIELSMSSRPLPTVADYGADRRYEGPRRVPSGGGSGESDPWLVGIGLLFAVAGYVKFQHGLLLGLMYGILASLGFLVGAVAYYRRTRISVPRWSILGAVAVAALQLLVLHWLRHPALQATAAQTSIQDLHRSGLFSSNGPRALIFVVLKIGSLVFSVLALVGSVEFGLRLVAHARVVTMLTRNRRARMAERLLCWLPDYRRLLGANVFLTAFALAVSSGAAYTAGHAVQRASNDAALKLVASTSTRHHGSSEEVCVVARSRFNSVGGTGLVLERKTGGEWRAVSEKVYQVPASGRMCVACPPGVRHGATMRWSSSMPMVHSNEVTI